jgi:hypothetical protein
MSLETLRQNFCASQKGIKGLKSGTEKWMIKTIKVKAKII